MRLTIFKKLYLSIWTKVFMFPYYMAIVVKMSNHQVEEYEWQNDLYDGSLSHENDEKQRSIWL